MAGAGWREWTAGEQLTDAKMQQFLQDQAVMRFANASARTTALNGVVSEGMITYLDDLNVVEVWDGSQWTELTGDPDIFTQGTAGQYLASLGTAGVEWSNIDLATSTTEGLVYGFTAGTTSTAYNVALGYNAAPSTSPQPTFIGNVAVGVQTLQSLTTGHNNVGFGSQTAISLTSGSKNTFIGSNSGSGQTTGDDNTFIGMGAGFGLQGGATSTTCLGQAAGGLTSPTLNHVTTNNTLIGYQAMPSAITTSNEITLGNSSIATLRCQVTSITALSDARDKENIEELPYGLEFVKALKPVSFDWNMRDGAKVGVPDIGFIAQDLVELEDAHDAERLALTLRNNPEKLEATQGRLIPILVKAIQELTARVEELENAR